MSDAPAVLTACVKTRLDGAPSCGGRGARDLIAAVQAEMDRRGQPLRVQEVQCLGRCALGPNMRVRAGAFLTGVTPEGVGAVCDALMAPVA